MSAHVHAEAMAQYAEDAKESDKPWINWECSTHIDEWFYLDGHPAWDTRNLYRRKTPKPIPSIAVSYYKDNAGNLAISHTGSPSQLAYERKPNWRRVNVMDLVKHE